MKKPVVAFIAGQTAPPGKRMGHAGAIISGGTGTAAEKMAAFEAVGVPVARIPSEIPTLIAEALERRRSRTPRAGRSRKANGPRRRMARPDVGKRRRAARTRKGSAAARARAAGKRRVAGAKGPASRKRGRGSR
jgi:hypothetical protein